MGNSVLIPLNLLKQICELLDYWDISNYDRVVRDDYDSIKRQLTIKMHKLELRDAYSKFLRASDDNARHSARIEYLWHKYRISDL